MSDIEGEAFKFQKSGDRGLGSRGTFGHDGFASTTAAAVERGVTGHLGRGVYDEARGQHLQWSTPVAQYRSSDLDDVQAWGATESSTMAERSSSAAARQRAETTPMLTSQILGDKENDKPMIRIIRKLIEK